MSLLSLILPEIGKPDKTEDPKLNTALTSIQTWANGNIGISNLEKEFLVGEWQTVALGAKIEEDTMEVQTIRVRKVLSAATVQLRGVPLVKAGQELASGETVLTLPVGYRPPAKIVLNVLTELAEPVKGAIATSGILALNKTIKAGQGIYLDGQSFNLI
jgi:hypothetical protein